MPPIMVGIVYYVGANPTPTYLLGKTLVEAEV